MEDRLKQLLRYVVEDVIATGEPIGSQHVVDTHDLGVSSATVRNWFAELEEAGYVTQPHTSSGRVPTERGYRLYVDELMNRRTLTKKEERDFREMILDARDREHRAKMIAKTIATKAELAVLVGLSDSDTYYTGLSSLFSQPEFRDWNRMVGLGQVLDRLDDVMHGLHARSFNEPQILIGSECPFGTACSAALVSLPDGIVMGVLGPMRMNYTESLTHLAFARALMNE